MFAATRFNKYFPYLLPTLLKFEFDCARKDLQLLDRITISPHANGVPRVDALEALSVVFIGMQHVQTALEASDNITTIKVIPMPEDLKALFHRASSDEMDSVPMMVPSLQTRQLATITLSAMDSIVYQDFWAASLVIHPGLCGHSFLLQSALHDVKAKDEALVEEILQELCLHVKSKDVSSSDMCHEPVTPVGSNVGASKWLLKSRMCFADICENDDELRSF